MESIGLTLNSLIIKKIELRKVADLNSTALLNQDCLEVIFQEVSLLFIKKYGSLTPLTNAYFKEHV